MASERNGADKPALGDILGVLIHKIDHAVYLHHNNRLAEFDITFQQALALTYLCENPGCNQRQLEEHMELRSPSVTVLLATMIDKGLLKKERDPSDGRNWRLFATAKGTRLSPKTRHCFRVTNNLLTKGMPPEEVEKLKELLRQVLQNIDE